MGNPCPWLQLQRTVRFGDTDAAGVMHFHQLLRWCHEAYEESLQRFGISAAELFPRPGRTLPVALPIVHCSADFFAPIACGDALKIELIPDQLEAGCFEVSYLFQAKDAQEPSRLLARGLTCHRAISLPGRQRCEVPAILQAWLGATEAPT